MNAISINIYICICISVYRRLYILKQVNRIRITCVYMYIASISVGESVLIWAYSNLRESETWDRMTLAPVGCGVQKL